MTCKSAGVMKSGLMNADQLTGNRSAIMARQSFAANAGG